jgi:hypothetical protein
MFFSLGVVSRRTCCCTSGIYAKNFGDTTLAGYPISDQPNRIGCPILSAATPWKGWASTIPEQLTNGYSALLGSQPRCNRLFVANNLGGVRHTQR